MNRIGTVVMDDVTVATRFKTAVIGTRSGSEAIWVGHIWGKDSISNIIFKVTFHPERGFVQIRSNFIHLISMVENKTIVQVLLTVGWDKACWEYFLLKNELWGSIR